MCRLSDGPISDNIGNQPLNQHVPSKHVPSKGKQMKTKARFAVSIVLRGMAIFLVFLLLSGSVALARQDLSAKVQVGARAEWDLPRVILMHTPGEEILHGVIWTQ